MKSLEQKLVEFKAKLENLSNTKLAVDNKSGSNSIFLKPKDEKFYIPPFKRNHKENAYITRLDKGKCSDVDAEISKLVSKPTIKMHKKSIFVPIYHIYGVAGHISRNCSLLRQKSKSETSSAVRNTNIPKFVSICHFCGVLSHIHPNCYKLKFKHSVFQSRICDDISLVISPNKLFHILLKNLSLLACKRKL